MHDLPAKELATAIRNLATSSGIHQAPQELLAVLAQLGAPVTVDSTADEEDSANRSAGTRTVPKTTRSPIHMTSTT